MGRCRVAVLGAGAGGLVSAKWLAAEGLDPVVFERSGRIGGIWTFDETLPGGGSPAYRSLVTNVSRQKTHLSDHELAAGLPDFPGRQDVLHWLEAYADRFALRPLIRFDTTVRHVEHQGGGWLVDGEPFDAVVAASGLFARPVVPAIDGRDRFGGRILHAADYRSPEPFAGLEVVVVGAGSSAADISVELAAVARVTIAVRSTAVVVPKTIDGHPLDHLRTRRLARRTAGERGRLLHDRIAGEYLRRGLPDPAAWPPGLALSAHGSAPTPSEHLVERIVDRTIALRPGVASLGPGTVAYADGSSDHADAVILATGYALELPFLPPGLLPVRGGSEVDLYRYVWHPDARGLAFVGLLRASGAVPPLAEMQARWVARVLAGRADLPSAAEMRREITERRARHAAAGTEYMRVGFLDYLDEIGGLIGVRPAQEDALLDAVVSATQYR